MKNAKNSTQKATVGRLTIVSPVGQLTPDAFCVVKARAACNFCVVR